MEEYEKNIVPHIEAIYENFTPLEKTIADFFIHNEEKLVQRIINNCYIKQRPLHLH